MSKQGKVWGETEEIFNNGIISIHFLKINKGGYCSEHSHDFKSNIFFVIQGNLKISIWNQEKVSDDTVLWAGESCEIPPKVFHKFEAMTDVDCLEIYETKLRGEDINRRTQGGKKAC